MSVPSIHRASGRALIVLSVVALICVLSGYAQPPQTDEGTAAHIFQLSIVAIVPTLLSFLATVDWKERWQSLRPLAFSAVTLAIAFGALYYLEHYR
jgi:energy-coupling factor transporter transmembrane protein EcfT